MVMKNRIYSVRAYPNNRSNVAYNNGNHPSNDMSAVTVQDAAAPKTTFHTLTFIPDDTQVLRSRKLVIQFRAGVCLYPK